MSQKRVILILINLLMLNLLLYRSGAQIDVTEDLKHSISPETSRLLEKLPNKAKIYLVASEERQAPLLKPLVSQLKDFIRSLQKVAPEKIDIEFINPYEDLEKRNFVENQFGVIRQEIQIEGGTQLIYFSVVLETGSHSKVYNNQDLVYFDPRSSRSVYRLNDLEPLFLRNLYQLSRQYENFRQAIAQAKGQQLTLIPIVSDDLEPQAKVRADLMMKKITDLSTRFSESIKIEVAPVQNKNNLELIRDLKLQAYPSRDNNDYYLHLLIRKANGDVSEVPNIMYINTIEGIDEAIKYNILLTLDQGDKQLGLLIPENRHALFMRQKTNHFAILENFLQHHYNLRKLDHKLKLGIPAGIGTLLVMGIDRFNTHMLEEIDRFVHRGGRLILFVDRHVTHMNPQTLYYQLTPMESGLEKMLLSWGVTLHEQVGFATQQENTLVMNWPSVRATTGRNNIELVPVAHSGVPVLNKLPSSALPLQGVKSVMLSYPNAMTFKQDSSHKHKIIPFLPGKRNEILGVPIDSWISPLIGQGEVHRYMPSKEVRDNTLQNVNFGLLLEGKFHPVETGDYNSLSPETRIAIVSDSDFFSSDFYLSQFRRPSDQNSQEQSHSFNVMKGHLYLNQIMIRNLVDWSFGDDDLLKVSSRDIKVRNLDLSDPSRQQKYEIITMGLPLLLLTASGFWCWRRRRRA